jgi:photosystem II stability/assembly factor-like uncharacterized protein
MEEELSLMDGAAEATEQAPTEPANDGWYLSEGVNGEGDRPEWFSDKYDSVSEQAKGYNELSKRFGGFTGSPEDYALNAPEEFGEHPNGGSWFDAEDANVNFIKDFGREQNMSQEAFDVLTQGWLRLTTSNLQEAQASEMQALGPQAGDRLDAIEKYGKANLSPEGFENLKGVVTSAVAVEVIEELIAKSKNAVMVDSAKTQTNTGLTREKLDEMVADPRYQESPTFRKEVDAKFQQLFG